MKFPALVFALTALVYAISAAISKKPGTSLSFALLFICISAMYANVKKKSD